MDDIFLYFNCNPISLRNQREMKRVLNAAFKKIAGQYHDDYRKVISLFDFYKVRMDCSFVGDDLQKEYKERVELLHSLQDILHEKFPHCFY